MREQERTSAHNYGSVEMTCNPEQTARKCCKIKYRVRYFHSKGAFLVLLWTALASTTILQSIPAISIAQNLVSSDIYGTVVVLGIYFCIPVIGWLADAKFGNYRVFRGGQVLLFLATIIGKIGLIITKNCQNVPHSVTVTLLTICIVMEIGGVATSLITALQLGLDQMPDASAANITSFIAWYLFSICAGTWVSDTLPNTIETCVDWNTFKNKLLSIGLSFIPPLSMTVACCSIFILAPRYLIVEPKSPRSLKTIYQVLKFAAKHKAPLNRSAFTYWEEDIPSRLDLGKSKYGGPFTTEQVEDVKTFFKIIIMLIPIALVLLSTTIVEILPLDDPCSFRLLSTFTSDWFWSGMVMTVLYELLLFPLVRNKLPSSLKRIGIAAFFAVIIKCLIIAETVVQHSVSHNHTDSMPLSTEDKVIAWGGVALGFLQAANIVFFFNGVFEFVCAQSPYNMRGLLTGCTVLVAISSVAIGAGTFLSNNIIFQSTTTALSLIGFILYCALARWYKWRVRDEDYSPHRVVEEIYDRYLSHVH